MWPSSPSACLTTSCHTVDALVIATAIRLGGGIVATGDPDDLRSLAREHANVKVQSLT